MFLLGFGALGFNGLRGLRVSGFKAQSRLRGLGLKLKDFGFAV